jgi:outer membrane protease
MNDVVKNAKRMMIFNEFKNVEAYVNTLKGIIQNQNDLSAQEIEDWEDYSRHVRTYLDNTVESCLRFLKNSNE